MNFKERLVRTINGDRSLKYEERVTVREALTTADAGVLIPEVISGIMLEAAEPRYLVSKWLQPIRFDGVGNTMVFPAIGALRAHDIPEGAPYPEEQLDINLLASPLEVKVTKVGLQVPITQEMISDSQWDVIGYHLRAAGRALGRRKEEKCFNEFSKHGHVVFDNMLRSQIPQAGTTGRDQNGNYNDTMSVSDMIDMIIAVMANGYVPTDILLHPLAWRVFAKNELIGTLSQGALGGYGVNYNSNAQTQYAPTIRINPDGVAGRLPFPISVTFSPFIPVNTVTQRFDMYVVDRNEIGIILEKEPITTDQFEEPARDIINLKVKERYGIGILNEGRAIAVARNIALEASYPEPVVVRTIPVAQ